MDKNRPRMNSSGRKFSMARALEEESARLEQFFHFADKLLVHQEENDMVSLFDNCLIVGHQDFIVADYGAYGGTRWQLDFAYLFTHDFAGAGITVGNGFNRSAALGAVNIRCRYPPGGYGSTRPRWWLAAVKWRYLYWLPEQYRHRLHAE